MFLKMKKRISDLIDTISEMLVVLNQLNNPLVGVNDCLNALEVILSQLDQEESIPIKTVEQLKIVKMTFDSYWKDANLINDESVKDLNNQILILKNSFEEEVTGKLNVVFFPYKASMWDSLATVYEAAAKDENCVAKVVPIPYYQLSQNEAITAYEGDRFPKNVPITHYSEYILEEQQPDIIFIHNIYDNYNTLTQVYEKYFTSNLKKYTDMLVFVPYHVSSFNPPLEGDRYLAYSTPSVKNVDKIILVNNSIKEAAIRYGIPAEKLLVLGSPKLDAMVNALNGETPYPKEWKEKIEGKTVYLVDTGCLYFANNPFLSLEKLIELFNIPRFVEDSVIIWRPHPLTKVSIKKYVPQFLDYYLHLTEECLKGESPLYTGIIFDENDDYLPALKAADVFITRGGSLLRSYLLTEKKVIYWHDNLPKGSLLPSDVFYYAFDKTEPWFELVKKISKGYDSLSENRKGLAFKVYANANGTSGEKVYQAIKECVLTENKLQKVTS